jgi:hypothetical protein
MDVDLILVAGVLIVLFAGVALAAIAGAIRSRTEAEEGFPTISDAEFLARCTPGTSPDVALKVRRIVADRLAVNYEQVYPSTRFVEDLGAD